MNTSTEALIIPTNVVLLVINLQEKQFNRHFFFFVCLQNTMNLPPDKVEILTQYDNEKKWELICDQVYSFDSLDFLSTQEHLYDLKTEGLAFFSQIQ